MLSDLPQIPIVHHRSPFISWLLSVAILWVCLWSCVYPVLTLVYRRPAEWLFGWVLSAKTSPLKVVSEVLLSHLRCLSLLGNIPDLVLSTPGAAVFVQNWFAKQIQFVWSCHTKSVIVYLINLGKWGAVRGSLVHCVTLQRHSFVGAWAEHICVYLTFLQIWHVCHLLGDRAAFDLLVKFDFFNDSRFQLLGCWCFYCAQMLRCDLRHEVSQVNCLGRRSYSFHWNSRARLALWLCWRRFAAFFLQPIWCWVCNNFRHACISRSNVCILKSFVHYGRGCLPII